MMSHRKQLASVIEEIIINDHLEAKDVNEEMINDYKSLNEKCDIVISKINKRKNKKQSPDK